MYEQEENHLQSAKASYDDIPVPEQLDDYIRKGIEQGRQAKSLRFQRRLGLVAASFLLIALMISIRVSPAFAAYVSQIPGLDYVVKLINYDKGLKAAVENDFIQPVGRSDEHDNILFTVDHIIIDESSMVVFYTLENKGEHSYLQVDRIGLLDEQGEHLKAGVSYETMGTSDMNKERILHGKFSAHFTAETIIPGNLTVELKLRELTPPRDLNSSPSQKPLKGVPPEEWQPREQGKLLNSDWKVTFPIDRSKFADAKQIYPLNQTVEVEGQKITFEKATIYPTRIALEYSTAPDNTMKIFGFDDLRLINEKGEEWAGISNGVVGTKLDENRYILYLQSNYFSHPKKLTLKGTSLRALDKEQLEVKLDLENKELLQAPPTLSLVGITNSRSKLSIEYHIQSDPIIDDSHSYGVFGHEFRDASGKTYNVLSTGGSFLQDTSTQIEFIELPADQPYQSPLTFPVSDYPNHIKKPFEIMIK